MFGRIPSAHDTHLRATTWPKRVVDLGCGDGGRALHLLACGAAAVLAIDAYEITATHPQLRACLAYFGDAGLLAELDAFSPDLALVAWPINHDSPGLISLLDAVPEILYVGANHSGTACGTPALFQYLRTRAVTAYLPDRANTLIAYGGYCPLRTDLYPEEIAGLEQFVRMHAYDATPAPRPWRAPRGH